MGISRATIKLLMREGNREKFSGKVLTIGVQNIFPTTNLDLRKLARKMNFQLKSSLDVLPLVKNTTRDNFITDDLLFSSLGFKDIDTLDCSDFEQCTIKHDLNIDVPDDLYEKYDLIFDGGSTEHIYNVPKVLENYHKMLRNGGRIIHALPTNNYVDHGFYMFSPTLFWDYYSANNWEISDSLFIRHPKNPDEGLWDIFVYSPHCLGKISYGSLSKGRCAIFFVVKKINKSTFNASVQQGFYLKKWDTKVNTANLRFNKGDSWMKKMISILPGWVKLVLRPTYYYVFSKIPLRFLLKNIGRY